MKKLSIITIIAITIIIATAVLTSNAFAQQRLFWLWGEVTYSEGGGGVGSQKPVDVSFPGEISRVEHDIVYTNADSQYQWGFSGSQYVFKVRCRFQVGDTWYSGETAINDTLNGDTRVDITVYEE